MTKEELLKAVSEIPKTKTKNGSIAYNSVSVTELANVVNRFKKIPNYNDLLLKYNKLEKEKDDLIKYLEDKIKIEKDAKEFTDKVLYESSAYESGLINAYQDILERVRSGKYE